MKILDSALLAVANMQTANTAMANAAGHGDVEGFKAASNDYDRAARDYNRAANRYTSNDCTDVTGLPLPTPPSKFPGLSREPAAHLGLGGDPAAESSRRPRCSGLSSRRTARS